MGAAMMRYFEAFAPAPIAPRLHAVAYRLGGSRRVRSMGWIHPWRASNRQVRAICFLWEQYPAPLRGPHVFSGSGLRVARRRDEWDEGLVGEAHASGILPSFKPANVGAC